MVNVNAHIEYFLNIMPMLYQYFLAVYSMKCEHSDELAFFLQSDYGVVNLLSNSTSQLRTNQKAANARPTDDTRAQAL